MKKLITALLLFLSLNACGGQLAAVVSAYVPAGASYATVADLIAARQQTIADKQAYWWNRPLPDTDAGMTGTVRRYCDCGTGSDPNCVQGNDTTGDGSDANPYRTVGAAATWITGGSSAAWDTVALCRGGAFPTSGNLHAGTTVGTRCTVGTMCNDFRDYSSTQFTSTARPKIYVTGNDETVFSLSSGVAGQYNVPPHYYNGVRIYNIEIQGQYTTDSTDSSGIIVSNNADIGFYNNYVHDFKIGIYNSEYFGPTGNMWAEANYIYHNADWGYIGASDYGGLNWNDIEKNGNQNALNHNVYISQGNALVHNFQFNGNYVTGVYGDGASDGTQVVSHSWSTAMQVKDNVVITPDAQIGGGWGMAFSNRTGNPDPVTYTDAEFSGNIIQNGGNKMFTVTGCPNCLIASNILLMTATINGVTAMDIPDQANRGYTNEVDNTANHIVNNTIYFGPNSGGASANIGIQVDTEGTNHVIANNAIYTAQTSGTFRCFNYGLALTAYDFINNNDCYGSIITPTWEQNHGSTLADWQTYATAYSFDANSVTSNPNFTAVGTNFHPTGAPLSGAGNNTYKPTTDILGNTRPNPPAIGAYEP